MQRTININKKPRTAKQIIAAKTGETKGGMNVSTIDGLEIIWDYRTDYGPSGYLHGDCTVTTADNAELIKVCMAGALAKTDYDPYNGWIVEI